MSNKQQIKAQVAAEEARRNKNKEQLGRTLSRARRCCSNPMAGCSAGVCSGLSSACDCCCYATVVVIVGSILFVALALTSAGFYKLFFA
jgi:hypothetical protein